MLASDSGWVLGFEAHAHFSDSVNFLCTEGEVTLGPVCWGRRHKGRCSNPPHLGPSGEELPPVAFGILSSVTAKQKLTRH